MAVNEIVNDIDDITDPSSMDKVLIYLEHLRTQDEEFMQLLITKIEDMQITWQLPWYQKPKCLSHPIKSKGEFEETYRTDTMTKEEADIIESNWQAVKREFQLPDTPQCLARWRNIDRNSNTSENCARHLVTLHLAKGLQRTLSQVYKFMKRHYGSPPQGHYSLQEEKIMEVCFYHNTKNAIPILSAVLGREPRGIYKKMEVWLNGKVERKRVKWTLPLAEKFLKLLMNYTGLSLEELKYRKFDRDIWIKIQNDMDHNYMNLARFWYNKLHVQLFVKQDVKIKTLRKKLIKTIQASSYQVGSDIRWKQIAKKFPDGFTYPFLYYVWSSIFQCFKKSIRGPLEELISYAKRKLCSFPNRRLKTLVLNNDGKLEVIRYDTKF